MESIVPCIVSFSVKFYLIPPSPPLPGMLSLLDEESRFPGATDVSFCQKIRKHLGSSRHLTLPEDLKSLDLSVSHFAGHIR